MSKKILLVEDEKSIADSVIYNLKAEGYKVTHVDEGPIALDVFNEEHFDLVILDIMLPEISGIEILKSIRKNSEIPVIMVTARDEEIDKVTGLELGADDYITKPFSIKELISRIKAVLRRTEQDRFTPRNPVTDTEKITVGYIEISPLRYEVRVNGNLIDLRPREFELLYFLCDNAGNLVSRDELFDQVWGYSFVGSSKTLDVHIQRIRERIEEDPKNPKILTTVRGMGYKLIDE
jgi:DNA-binding response OmpR family regulator